MSVARRAAGHRPSAMPPLAPSTARSRFSAASTSARAVIALVCAQVQVAEADAVVSYLGVVRCLL